MDFDLERVSFLSRRLEKPCGKEKKNRAYLEQGLDGGRKLLASDVEQNGALHHLRPLRGPSVVICWLGLGKGVFP